MKNKFNIPKPTHEEIRLWVANQLDEEGMKKVTAGLLLYKDADIQDYLQQTLLQDVEQVPEPEEALFSNLSWIKNVLQDIFSNLKEMILPIYEGSQAVFLGKDEESIDRTGKETLDISAQSISDWRLSFSKHQGKYLTLSLSLTDEHPGPLYLGSEEEVEKSIEKEKIYTVSIQSNSDLQLLIRIPKGKYLVTTIFVNSREEMGFMYPDLNIVSPDNLEKWTVNNETTSEITIPIIQQGGYTLNEDEVDFIVTRCPLEEKSWKAFVSCVQEMEELGVIRWLRYIKQNGHGDFNVVNIRFQLQKSDK